MTNGVLIIGLCLAWMTVGYAYGRWSERRRRIFAERQHRIARDDATNAYAALDMWQEKCHRLEVRLDEVAP